MQEAGKSSCGLQVFNPILPLSIHQEPHGHPYKESKLSAIVPRTEKLETSDTLYFQVNLRHDLTSLLEHGQLKDHRQNKMMKAKQ